MRTMTRRTTAAGLGLALLLGTAGVATAAECTQSGDVYCLGSNTVTVSRDLENTILAVGGVTSGPSVADYAR